MSLPIACHHERERGYVCPFCKTFRLSPERPGAGSYSVEGTYRAANQNVEIIRLALVPSPQFYNDSGKLVYRTDEEPSAGIGREVLDAVKLRHLRNEIRRWHQGFREHAEQVGAGSLTTRLDASLQAMSPPPPANPGKRYDDNQRAIVARAYLDARAATPGAGNTKKPKASQPFPCRNTPARQTRYLRKRRQPGFILRSFS